MNNIGWCDITRNYWAGCTKCSPGCQNCYAEKFAIRHCGNPKMKEKYEGTIENGHWSGLIKLCEKEFQKPLPRKPCRIFVNSMTDTFHENVPFEWINRLMAVIMWNPRHKFMILTKRPERMMEYYRWIIKKHGHEKKANHRDGL